ncbi:MAG: hypothetical protein V8R81_01755 [Clostridia bacterium]
MIKEIWENLKNAFTFMFDTFLSKLIKPMYITLTLLCIYFFMIYLINYNVIVAFLNLFTAIVFFRLFEEGE